MPMHLAKLILALTDNIKNLPEEIQKLLIGLEPDEAIRNVAKALKEDNACLVTGALCDNHPEASLLRTFIFLIEKLSGAKVLRLTQGANSAGAWMAGMVPHRTTAGKSVSSPGMDVQAAINAKLKAYF